MLNAQAGLNGAQNALFGLWINYLNTRIQLYRDLELMPLDFRGVWTDELAPNGTSRIPGGLVVPRDESPVGDERPGDARRPVVPARLLAPTETAAATPH